MLSSELQIELTLFLNLVNDHLTTIAEKTNEPNFEAVYWDSLVHPHDETVRLVARLDYHRGENIAKLTVEYERNNGPFGSWSAIRYHNDVLPRVDVAADYTQSDAIRWAQKAIKEHEAIFIEVFEPKVTLDGS